MPVVRWLQVGSVAAGLGLAMAFTPAIASVEEGVTASASTPHVIPPVRAAGTLRRGAAALSAPNHAAPTAKTIAAAVSTDPFGNIAAFLGVSGAPATSAPSLGSLPLLLRLSADDIVSGIGPAPVTNATAAVTGLSNQVLRENPTADELQNYLGLEGQTDPQKYDSVVDYLWGNVLRMRTLNPYIPGATSRSVMPQSDPLPKTSEKWAGGTLSYSFPTISYLG